MRFKAYYLKMLLHTYNMIIRPIEKFLRPLEVERVKSFCSQMGPKTWIFESFAGSKITCVENKAIPCICTHFLLVVGNIDSTW